MSNGDRLVNLIAMVVLVCTILIIGNKVKVLNKELTQTVIALQEQTQELQQIKKNLIFLEELMDRFDTFVETTQDGDFVPAEVSINTDGVHQNKSDIQRLIGLQGTSNVIFKAHEGDIKELFERTDDLLQTIMNLHGIE